MITLASSIQAGDIVYFTHNGRTVDCGVIAVTRVDESVRLWVTSDPATCPPDYRLPAESSVRRLPGAWHDAIKRLTGGLT